MCEGLVCMGTRAVMYKDLQREHCLWLGKKDLKIKFKSGMTQMSQVSKTICQKDYSADSYSVVVSQTSCQNPQMIDPRKHQPQKKQFWGVFFGPTSGN